MTVATGVRRVWRVAAPQQVFLSEAGDGVRTHDPQLGKLMLYQLSYARVDVHSSRVWSFGASERPLEGRVVT